MSKRILIVAALALGFSDVASAATLYAGPLTTMGGLSRCFATNVSKKAIAIDLTLFSSSGTEIDQTTCPEVAPGHSCVVDASSGTLCRVETSGGKSAVRGTLAVSPSSSLAETIATSEAR